MSSSSSQAQPLAQRVWRLASAVALTTFVLAAICAALFGLPLFTARAAGTLSVKIIAAYNLVVDSNVLAPSTYAPSVATVAGKVCNTSGETVTGTQLSIGNYNGGTGSTPGIYPARNSATDPAFLDPLQYQYLASTGLYSFTHVGGRMGLADATRYVGTLLPGQCQVQYWHFTYPRRSNGAVPPYTPNAGNQPTWGQTRMTSDDLALGFDIWSTAKGGVGTTNQHQTMTVRNEISAMANKIQPNPDGQWFNTNSSVVKPGDVITSNGILYELGVINQGFDNDGDYTPDFNAWVQPIGDPAYDPSCFRLIRTSGLITVSRNGGNPDTIIPFTDQLYFTNLPSDNNGVRGLVFYTFMSLNGPCTTGLSPYQEVASGSNNEKFNGDFGAGIPPVASSAPDLTIDKSGTVTVLPGQRITYTIKATNLSVDTPAGLPLSSIGLVLSDSIPANTSFVAGSIVTDSNTTILYSTDGGATWSEDQPVPATSVTNVQAWQNNPLNPSSSSTFTFSVQVVNTFPANTPPAIENCAAASFGQTSPFARDCAITRVQGNYMGGHYVWRDENRNTITDTNESYLTSVPLTLYYDANNNGVIDASESAISQTQTSSPGYYTFTQLYTGSYIVSVDTHSGNIPYGYRATTPITHALVVSGTQQDYRLANFGFGPTLTATKSLIGTTYAGDLASYRIGVSNLRPGGGTTTESGQCVVQSWSGNASTPNSPKNFVNPASIIGAPNGTFASADFRTGANKEINALAFTKGTLPGTISKVEAVWSVYVQPGVGNDWLNINVYSGTIATPLGGVDTTSMSSAYLNKYIGPSNTGVITSLVTPPAGGWSWNVIGSLITQLSMQKTGSADDSIFYVDGAGLQVYFNGACPAADPSEIMTVVPLTDTYDTNYLTYVGSVPPASDVNLTTGVITWTNVGPLDPGQTVDVQVIFRAKYPVNPAASINNTMCVSGTKFLDNGPANNACGTATGVISPAGYITGVVWSDIAPLGWQGTSGFDSSDARIPAVNATLFRCEWDDGSGIIAVPAPDNNKTCDAQSKTGAKGTWMTITTKSTTAIGYYDFTGLVDGYYRVQIDPNTLPTGFAQTADPSNAANGAGITCGTCDNAWGASADTLRGGSTNITPIQNSNTITQVNFGYTGNPFIHGTVWHDLSGDGTRQSTDPALDNGTQGITVTLYNASTGAVVSTTQTNANGAYQFANLTAGQAYTVSVSTGTLPGGGWIQTSETGPNADGNLNSSQRTVTLAAGQVSGSYDFGYYQGGSLEIGDLVYYDFDGNGSPTSPVGSSVEGIPNVTLYLYRDNGNGVFDSGDGIVSTTTTSNAGAYLFSGLPAATYFVAVNPATLPINLTETADPDELGVCNICNDRGKVVLSSTSVYTIDFGYQPHGSGAIGDTVWRDMNGDGIQSGPQETGIAGILVTLTVDLNGDGTYVPVMTRTTDATGYYLFNDLSQTLLPQGNYRVQVDSASANLPKDGYGLSYIPSTPITHTASITISQVYLSADFGFVPLGAIGDTIYWDANNNAQQDWSESGIPGINVSLVNASAVVVGGVTFPAGSYQLNTTTNANGTYLLTGLVSGTYTVTVTNPPATLTGDPEVYSNSLPCNGVNASVGCDNASRVVLGAGASNLSQDFGYRPTGVIGDFVFNDLNNDGLQTPGEPGIASVVVTVTNGTTTYTAITDIDGRYSFSNVANGTWTVQFQTPANMISVPSSSGTPIVNGTGSVGTSTTVVIASGAVNNIGGNNCSNCSLNIDSGFRLNGAYTVSGHVFYDASGNGGIYSPTVDLPYGGITVYLYNSGNQLIGSTTTNASGAYTFTNIPVGNYTVSYNPASPQLAYMIQTASPANTTGNCSPCLNYYLPGFNVSGNVSDLDFGLYAQMDFGDLPDSYGTTVGADGARHVLTTTNPVYLGTAPDADGNGLDSSTATRDNTTGVNDENGVFRGGSVNWTPGANVSLIVSATGSNGYLVGWFDWNNDGSFDQQVTYGNIATGNGQTWNITIPTTYTTGTTVNARFRIYSGLPAQISPKGVVTNGEVEDYQWTFNPTAVSLAEFNAQSAGPTPLIWAIVGALVLLASFVVYRRFRRHAA